MLFFIKLSAKFYCIKMINVPALLALLICVLLFDGAYAGTSLMGVGGGGGGMPKGISFNIDTNDKRTTRIHGNAIKVDLDMLEIMTNGGKLKYSPTHMEFETGTTRWMTTMTPVSESCSLNIYPSGSVVIFQYAACLISR
jgi:hypothetical protein